MWLSNSTVVSGSDELENNSSDLRHFKSFKRVPGDFFSCFVLYQKVTLLFQNSRYPETLNLWSYVCIGDSSTACLSVGSFGSWKSEPAPVCRHQNAFPPRCVGRPYLCVQVTLASIVPKPWFYRCDEVSKALTEIN